MSQIKERIFRYIKTTDKWLWLLCWIVSLVGVVLLYGCLKSGHAYMLSIRTRNLLVQCAAIVLGVLSAIVISLIDYNFLRKTWVVHVPFSYLLVLLTFFIGTGASARPDDKRWLVIPVLNVWLQPAELLKISFILIFAYHITHCADEINKPVHVALLGAHALAPVLLVHFQGDDGTALLIATIALTMLFAAGLSWKYLVAALAGIAALAPILWRYIMNPFQKERILVLLHQAEADPLGVYYQQYQAKMAAAHGGATGIGLLGADHIYVPEMHTDFIFSFLCESFGLMGALGVALVMAMLCLKILYNSQRADDAYGSLICVGVFAMILFQFAINVGMCLSLMPVIGNTFPFLSYGGSSVVTNYLGIGLVMSVSMHRKTGMFSS